RAPLLPQPPTSTLFPYTTLFRSRGDNRRRPAMRRRLPRRHHGEPRGVQVPLGRKVFRQLRPALGCPSGHVAIAARSSAFVTSGADRKSTRLNSSHVASSYAVFCL